jgi:hypothetical protein
VAVAAPDDIWAVGFRGDYGSAGPEALIERWDGTQWNLMPVTNTGVLRGVSVAAPDDVWAVGYTDESPVRTMTLHWNGTAWTRIPSPSIPATLSYLYAVAAAGSDDVWAVGASGSQALVLRWNGVQWNVVPIPQIDISVLNAVAVVAPDDVWAVGSEGYVKRRTLILHWDGTTWTQVASPSPGTYSNSLQALSVLSADSIWAAGWHINADNQRNGTILRWDGSAWSVTPIPTPPGAASQSPNAPNAPYEELHGIAAASATEAWAVGWVGARNNVILKWDGSSWTRIHSPNPSPNFNELFGVAVVAPGEAWAVGMHYRSGGYYDPQILHYGPPCGTPTPTVTGTPPTSTSTRTPTFTRTASNTPGTPTATPCASGPITVQGSIETTDLVQNARLWRDGVPDTCAVPGTCGSPTAGLYHYDLYSYANTGNVEVCVTVTVEAACIGNRFIYSGAYLGSFDPSNVCANWLADLGSSPNGAPGEYSFNVPAGATLLVNVHETNRDIGCASYTLTISGLPDNCPTGTPSPPTSTAVATNTRTRTATPFMGTPTLTSTPNSNTAYAHFAPAAPLTVTVGTTFTLDLMVNAGTHNAAVQQSYLTFTNSLLQVVDASTGECVVTGTISPDVTTFEVVLQNEVCNSTEPCDFGRIVAPPASIAFASGALLNPPGTGDFRVAGIAFCADTLGTATIHWEFSPPAPPARHSEIVDPTNATISNPGLYADYVVHIVPDADNVLVGHAFWQGRPAQPNALQQMPITLTLKSGTIEVDYPAQTTDVSGYFTIPLGTLPTGTYIWRAKGPKYLANGGSVVITGDPTTGVEIGLMRAGDANDNNVVNSNDFIIMRSTFGLGPGDPGYDDRADFTGDQIVNSLDFILLRNNFGTGGAPPIGP